MRALVIEGGGMRAAYANGVLAALEDEGHRHFDAVYGTSAGGALAAWWSAGQARYACGTWKYAGDRRILSYRRWLARRGPLLDHDELFEVVYKREMPLDVKAIRNAPHPVIVTVTSVETGWTYYPDIRRGPVLDWLRATGRLPLGTGPPVEVNGGLYLDGGVTDPIPIRKAVEDGHREIVCILNRPPGRRGPEPSLATAAVAARFPQLAEPVRLHHELHNRAVDLAENPPPGVTVHIIRPARELGLGRLTRSLDRVQAGIDAGVADGRAWVKASPPA